MLQPSGPCLPPLGIHPTPPPGGVTALSREWGRVLITRVRRSRVFCERPAREFSSQGTHQPVFALVSGYTDRAISRGLRSRARAFESPRGHGVA
jgi:hypothetical protein